MQGCLEGIRVLDLAQFLAAPFAATWLGDLGADVIKIESPAGDDMRRWGRSKNGKPLMWKMLSRNKRSVTLNLKAKRGVEMFLKLVEQADVVVENMRPGKLAALGLGYDVLKKTNPKVVLMSISAYGQTGPYSMRPGFGTLSEAMSGYASITGEDNGPPLLPAFGLADSIAGMAGAISILAALRARDKSGRGQHIDISLLEPLMSVLEPMFVNYDQLGLTQLRQGSRLEYAAPRNIYKTKDGKFLAMSSTGQNAFERTMAAIGLAHMVEDERFKTNPMRVKNVGELDPLISDWVAKRTLKEALDILIPAGSAAGPVYAAGDVFTDEHVIARECITTVDDPDLGKLKMANIPVRMSENQPQIKFTGRDLGADNAAVYGELLGIGADEMKELKTNKVI